MAGVEEEMCSSANTGEGDCQLGGRSNCRDDQRKNAAAYRFISLLLWPVKTEARKKQQQRLDSKLPRQ